MWLLWGLQKISYSYSILFLSEKNYLQKACYVTVCMLLTGKYKVEKKKAPSHEKLSGSDECYLSWGVQGRQSLLED